MQCFDERNVVRQHLYIIFVITLFNLLVGRFLTNLYTSNVSMISEFEFEKCNYMSVIIRVIT